MWKEIEIKPEDQSLVGRKIKKQVWGEKEAITVLCIGRIQIFARDADEREISIYRIVSGSADIPWQVYEADPIKKMRAPALVMTPLPPVWDANENVHRVVRGYKVSSELYSSYEEAKHYLRLSLFSWPAIPNKEGFYEIPD